eukprot:scaffold695_cov384-Prasinococcus_capsulatus_cf.AAC.12
MSARRYLSQSLAETRVGLDSCHVLLRRCSSLSVTRWLRVLSASQDARVGVQLPCARPPEPSWLQGGSQPLQLEPLGYFWPRPVTRRTAVGAEPLREPTL